MRLTNSIRSHIVNNLLLASPLYDQYVKLRQEMTNIAEEITLHFIPETVQRKVVALNEQLHAKEILRLSTTVCHFNYSDFTINIAGQNRTVSVNFTGHSQYGNLRGLRLLEVICNHEFKKPSPLLATPTYRGGQDYFVLKIGLKSKLAERYIALYDEAEELSNQVSDLEKTLTAQLAKFTSDTTLIAEWPEVKDYIPAPRKKPSTELSVPVGTLNKMVGLPKDKK